MYSTKEKEEARAKYAQEKAAEEKNFVYYSVDGEITTDLGYALHFLEGCVLTGGYTHSFKEIYCKPEDFPSVWDFGTILDYLDSDIKEGDIDPYYNRSDLFYALLEDYIDSYGSSDLAAMWYSLF